MRRRQCLRAFCLLPDLRSISVNDGNQKTQQRAQFVRRKRSQSLEDAEGTSERIGGALLEAFGGTCCVRGMNGLVASQQRRVYGNLLFRWNLHPLQAMNFQWRNSPSWTRCCSLPFLRNVGCVNVKCSESSEYNKSTPSCYHAMYRLLKRTGEPRWGSKHDELHAFVTSTKLASRAHCY